MPQNEKSITLSLRESILKDAILILNSISFYEKQIYAKLAEIDEAENNKLFDEFPRLERETVALCKKIDHENQEMDRFLIKYRRLVNDEKQKILSHS
jgi:hypothetical protein